VTRERLLVAAKIDTAITAATAVERRMSWTDRDMIR
jgi:hypothetical protein